MNIVEPITDDASYERAEARASELMNNCSTDAEREELDALSDAIDRYARANFEVFRVQTDGPDHLEFRLDQGMSTLDELERVFGGRDAFIAYMTRQRNLDDATVDALVTECNIDRNKIDKEFSSPPGWQDIDLEPRLSGGDSKCCDSPIPDWRAELTGIGRMLQDTEWVRV